MKRITNAQKRIVRNAVAQRDAMLSPALTAGNGDAEFLRNIARRMTYNGTAAEAIVKHRLFEIAARLEALTRPATASREP